MAGVKYVLSGKQKSFLRGLGNGLGPLFQVGKGGVTPNLVGQVNDALQARELIKLRVLPQAPLEPRQAAAALAEAAGAELVQVIGRNLLLYRRSKERLIDLP
jgi:RNA-binding protein